MQLRSIRIALVVAGLGVPARTQTTELESRTALVGNSGSNEASISADGRFTAFASSASNLVAGDTNSGLDVFVRDNQTGAIERVSISTGGAQSNQLAELPTISSDGRFVAYDSFSTNLVAGDANGAADIFLRDRLNGTTELVSLTSGGAQANSDSFSAAISADGRYVAFQSNASNLVPGDTNSSSDIFVRDRQTGTTERVSVGAGGAQANGISLSPAISADGRFVVFSSDATNLVAGDANGMRDVFVRDRQLGTTQRVSLGVGGVASNDASYSPVGVSANGRFICFESNASNLVATDANGGQRDVFVRDMQTGTNEIASVSTGGVQGTTTSWSSQISPDGRYVVFASFSTNLVAGDTNGREDIFVRDRQAGTTVRASLASNGDQGNLDSLNGPAISADGNRVAFTSNSTNLYPGDGNGVIDVFLRDRPSGTTVIVSGPAASGNGASEAPVVSDDGSLVAFQSDASNLVLGDANGASDVFVAHRPGGPIERISVGMSGADANGASVIPTMTPDGRFVAFASSATNLVPGDTNGFYDVFLRDRTLGTTERISVSSSGTQANSQSGFYQGSPSFSLGLSITPDGRYVAFTSLATNLAPQIGTGSGDVYVRDRQAGTTEMVSLSSTGGIGNGASYAPSISADGRYVVFHSFATNFLPGDTNGAVDVFLRDRQAGTTQLVSVANGGGFGNGVSGFPVISANGRYAAFTSVASNLVAGDANGDSDLFVRDLQAGTTELASVSTAGIQGSSVNVIRPSISEDGRFVAFTSFASNLVAGDANGTTDIFLRDRLLKTTALVSVATSGAQGTGPSGSLLGDYAVPATLSAGGRYVAFMSLASNFDPADTNSVLDVFLRDRGAAASFVAFCFGDGTGAACPCSNSGAPGHGCENSSTTGGAVLAGSGVASLSADSAHFTCSGEKPTATSVLLSGNVVANSLHYGDGLRCVGGTLKRLYTHNAVGGVVTMPQGADASISARSAASGDVISIGTTRIYQVYYRDPIATFCPSPSGSTFNISNAVAVAWEE